MNGERESKKRKVFTERGSVYEYNQSQLSA